jgi:hypothetical protein
LALWTERVFTVGHAAEVDGATHKLHHSVFIRVHMRQHSEVLVIFGQLVRLMTEVRPAYSFEFRAYCWA